MAKKKEIKETEDSIVVDAAKAIGSAAGKIAKIASAFTGTPTPARKRVGKLPKKNKSRLPRKEKKAQQKARRSA